GCGWYNRNCAATTIGTSDTRMPAFRNTFMLVRLTGSWWRRLDDHAFLCGIIRIDDYFLVASKPAEYFQFDSVIPSGLHVLEMYTPHTLRVPVSMLDYCDVRPVGPPAEGAVR